MNKKLWIISELFYPNESATAYILSEMAKKFTGGYNVNVVCADTNYEGDNKRVSGTVVDIPGINVHRVSVPELDKNNILKRLVRFLSVSRKLYKKAKEDVRPGDTVFAVTNPAFLLPYIKRLKKNKKLEYILLVHDVFPENALATGVLKIKPLYSVLKKVFDKSYAAADKILVLGEDMKEIVASKTGRADNVFVCENWGSDAIVPQDRPDDGKIVLQYAGNIGRVQGLEDWVEMAAKTKNASLFFDFWGSGALVPFLNIVVAENRLANVRIRGSYNRATQNEVLNDCDIAVISLAKGMKGLGVPSKTYNILAAGKPILYIGDEGSEIYNLVKKYDLGYVFTWDQKKLLLDLLDGLTLKAVDGLRAQGRNARLCYEKYYTKEIVMNKIMDSIK